jgi:hypothetical protein
MAHARTSDAGTVYRPDDGSAPGSRGGLPRRRSASKRSVRLATSDASRSVASATDIASRRRSSEATWAACAGRSVRSDDCSIDETFAPACGRRQAPFVPMRGMASGGSTPNAFPPGVPAYAAGRTYRTVAASMCGVQSGQNPCIVRPANQLDGFSTRPVSLHAAQRYDGTTSAKAGAAGVGGRAGFGAVAGAEHAPCQCRPRLEIQG